MAWRQRVSKTVEPGCGGYIAVDAIGTVEGAAE